MRADYHATHGTRKRTHQRVRSTRSQCRCRRAQSDPRVQRNTRVCGHCNGETHREAGCAEMYERRRRSVPPAFYPAFRQNVLHARVDVRLPAPPLCKFLAESDFRAIFNTSPRSFNTSARPFKTSARGSNTARRALRLPRLSLKKFVAI
jgi:hypothetical protein